MPVEIYDSPSCGIHPAGWVKLASGASITRMPLWDAGASLFCRWGAAEAAQKLAAWGMRLPTWQEYEELHSVALFIEPVTLPTAAMLKAAGIAVSNQGAVNAYRDANMSSRAWCAIHDAAVFKELAAALWNGHPVANAGKHWCADGAIYGWWQKNGAVIQPLSYFHEPGRVAHVPPLGMQRDYATTCHAVAAAGKATPPPKGGKLYPPGSPTATTTRLKGAGAGLLLSAIASGILYFIG